MDEQICHICYSKDIICDDEPMICDRCDEYYCYDCSYAFTLHFEYYGSMCYHCSNQNRKVPLNRREAKINYLLGWN